MSVLFIPPLIPTRIRRNEQESAGMDRNFRYIFVLICSIFISHEFLQILIYLIVNNIQLFLYILTKKRMKIKGKSKWEAMGGLGHEKVGIGTGWD